METAVVMIGIGGQGVQLMAKTLAVAAIGTGRQAMLSSEYGGEMRGGPSQATVVMAEGAVQALPILPSTPAVIVAHDKHQSGFERLAVDGLAVVNSSVADPSPGLSTQRVVSVPATELAASLGSIQAAGFVLLAAYAEVVGIVGVDDLAAAMRQLVPSYRRQHVEMNERALRAGAECVAEQVSSAAVAR